MTNTTHMTQLPPVAVSTSNAGGYPYISAAAGAVGGYGGAGGTGTYANVSVATTYTVGYNGVLNATVVVIQGKSLASAIENIERMLGILQTSSELEEKWKELKELGDKYRALKAEIEEKEMYNLFECSQRHYERSKNCAGGLRVRSAD